MNEEPATINFRNEPNKYNKGAIKEISKIKPITIDPKRYKKEVEPQNSPPNPMKLKLSHSLLNQQNLDKKQKPNQKDKSLPKLPELYLKNL